ncbi:hypothetical protein C0Q70_09667 [Pomacea canaliculata]|uniref:Uncharacterized protein n=1 Tax=Pomacea canaliculata TaxID=400727 RepID=A0A2T7PAG5_POMCA|nr:hypothetical protein C0Q70_09667 [Pomacea canaliculata]
MQKSPVDVSMYRAAESQPGPSGQTTSPGPFGRKCISDCLIPRQLFSCLLRRQLEHAELFLSSESAFNIIDDGVAVTTRVAWRLTGVKAPLGKLPNCMLTVLVSSLHSKVNEMMGS